MMNKLSAWIFLLIPLAFISCDNELDVNGPFQENTIVYAILDPAQDTQWVRVQRAFMGDQGADGGRNNPDSLYYSQLQVKVTELFNGNRTEHILTKDSTSRQLEDGYFTTEGFHLYRFEAPVNPDASYELEITRPDSTLVTSFTPIVGDFNINSPNSFQRLTFARPSGQDIGYSRAVNGRIYQGYIRFYYKEQNRFSFYDTANYYLDFPLVTQYSSSLDGQGVDISQNVGYDDFFGFLVANLEADPNINRFFKHCDIFITSGEDDFATYLNVTRPSNGIVQDRPNFTNINNGLGLFSSKNLSERLVVDLSVRSLDSLYFSDLTCDLRFGKPATLDTLFCQ
ncbi:MAG: hypothetical protein SchgKO_24210 [Schleiferiaceae bacterium]